MVRHFIFKVLFILIFLCATPVTSECPFAGNSRPVIECLLYLTRTLYGIGIKDLEIICTTSADMANCLRRQMRDCIAADFTEATMNYIEKVSENCCPNRNHPRCPISEATVNEQRCFAADSRIQLVNGKEISLSELRPGDRIFTYDRTMQKLIPTTVLTMLDKQFNEYALFKQLTTSTGEQLTITPSHLLPTTSSGYLMAKHLTIGMSIYVQYENGSILPSTIDRIVDVVQQGYLAPLTSEGTLLVNRIGASCYATISNHHLAHVVLAPMRWWYQWFTDSSDRIGIAWYPKLLFHLTISFL